MQTDRRRDPYPWTWEPFVAAVCAYLMTAVIVTQMGRTVANGLAGAGWRLRFAGTIHVLAGDAGAGLPWHFVERGVASTTALYVCVGLGQLALLALGAYGAILWFRRWGPGRVLGTATPTEAEQLLGVARLRKNAAVIRPDLYGKGSP